MCVDPPAEMELQIGGRNRQRRVLATVLIWHDQTLEYPVEYIDR